jgi:uncharacterized protein
MSIYVFVLEMKKLLRGLDGWIDKAVAHAQAKKFDPNVLAQARLAPDMFSFVRQVQATCDQAKFAASRVAGKEPPSHPDTEQTLDDCKKRIATVVAYLDSFSEKDFENVADRTVTRPQWEGKSLTALHYFVEHAQPNFYFHLTTAYAILRHNGVDVGKRDFIGQLTWKS